MFWIAAALAAPFPDLLAPPAPAAPTADAAVVIGLEDYGFLPDVPYARRDAMAVRTLLVTRMGVAPDRVRMLTSGNREQILTAIDEASALVAPSGKLVVWFSGHGATSPTDGSLMWIGDDAKPQPDAFASRSVSVAELAPRVPSDTLLVVDACAAGQGRDGQALLPGTRFAVPTWATPAPGLRVWTAAAPTELAEPYPAAQHGLFTALAVGALRGWGDSDGDGLVRLHEAQDYVQRAMLTVGARQTPTFTGADLVIAPTGEAGPELAGLPRLNAPEGGTDEASGRSTVAPYTLAPGGFADATGRTISLNLLVADLASAAVRDLQKRKERQLIAGAAGIGIAGLSTVVGGYVAAFHAISESSGISPVVPLGTKLAVPGVFAVGGTGLAVGGLLASKRTRQRIVEEANRTPAVTP